jgi:integrase
MRPVEPIKRNGFWYLIRRVPRRYEAFDTRGIVKVSTRIRIADDPRAMLAARAVSQLNRDLEEEWRAKASGEKPKARQRYDNAVLDARGLGFPYMTTPELALRPIEELVRRVEKLIERRSGDVPEEVTALLGGEDRPEIRISDLLTEYEEIMAATLSKMSPDQQRKWKNVRKRAIANLERAGIAKPVTALTREDGLRFRKWWIGRIMNDGLEIKSANKELGIVNRMLTRVAEAKELPVQPAFSKLRIEGGVDKQREPYEVDFIQGRILASGMFDDLNEEARRVIYIMIETGLRPSEIVNLTPKRIKLSHPVPHVVIEAEGRVLKSEPSERKIPLVGVSLAAMRLQPQGFPRYFDKADNASNLINKALDARRLRPHEKHSLYSIRHAFEDRLTALKIMPDKIQAYLMGHTYPRPKYGGPPKLDHLAEWLNKIAFPHWPQLL